MDCLNSDILCGIPDDLSEEDEDEDHDVDDDDDVAELRSMVLNAVDRTRESSEHNGDDNHAPRQNETENSSLLKH